MQKQQKYSRQREALISLLKSATNHPSAEWLHEELKKEFPAMGIATVYRNLNLLSQSGEILKIDVGSGKEHYDGDTRNHYHFFCNICHSIYDVEMEYEKTLDTAAEKLMNAEIDSHSLVFYGTCRECRK